MTAVYIPLWTLPAAGVLLCYTPTVCAWLWAHLNRKDDR